MTTIKGREDNNTEERMLAILLVCCLFFGCYLFGLPHAGYGRGIMTEDGGGDNGTRGQHCRRKYVGYTIPVCCFLFFLIISLLSPTCWLWRRDNDEVDGGDNDQRDERTTSPKNVCWLYYLSVVVVFCGYLFGLPYAGYGRGIMTEDGGGDNGTRRQHC